MKPDGRVGRPPVGPEVKIAFQPELLAMIDDCAKAEGKTRAAWVREACLTAVRASACGWGGYCSAPVAATVTEESPDGLSVGPRDLCDRHAQVSLAMTTPGWTTTVAWSDGRAETVTS